jgi:hypothetical protein
VGGIYRGAGVAGLSDLLAGEVVEGGQSPEN